MQVLVHFRKNRFLWGSQNGVFTHVNLGRTLYVFGNTLIYCIIIKWFMKNLLEIFLCMNSGLSNWTIIIHLIYLPMDGLLIKCWYNKFFGKILLTHTTLKMSITWKCFSKTKNFTPLPPLSRGPKPHNRIRCVTFVIL